MPLLPAALALALAAPGSARDAASRLVAERPAAIALRAAGGGLAHLSGLAEPRLARGDEENARRFLGRAGAAFGVDDPAALETVRVLSAPGAGGAAVFRRRVRGLPVFGGEIAVGWRGDGAITVVNGSAALATEPAGAHRVTPGAAVVVALAAAGGEPGAVEVEPGWLEFDGRLVPVHRVGHGVLSRAAWSFVDAGAGTLLYRISRARRAAPWSEPCPAGGPCIRAFLASPLAPPPPGPAGNAAQDFRLQGLAAAAGAKLSGERATVYDCAGLDQGAKDFPLPCQAPRPAPGGAGTVGGQTATADASGSFLADPDPTQIDVTDVFAQQSAYFHIDSHSRFLDVLDPTFAGRTPAGGIGRMPGYVNVRDGTSPLDNAFFAPGAGPAGTAGIMVFGQGERIDLAYDAEVLYHELTHAAIEVTAGFQGITDTLGVNSDPDAINEGSADTFAFAHVGESLQEAGVPVASASCLSRYFGAALGRECLREARSERTCRGAGPNVGRDPGRTGEVHDDGEIWTGYTWALYEEAARHGLSLAMAKALFQALVVAGPHPTYAGFAATVGQKVKDLGLGADAERFTACTAAQRDLAGCEDRGVPLYSGERAQGIVFGLLSSSSRQSAAGQQYFVDVPCGATALRIQTGDSDHAGTLYVRRGEPVRFGTAGLGSPQYDWMASGNHAELVLDAKGCAECAPCSGTRTALGGGRWWFLRAGAPDAVFHLGVTIDMPPGEAPPVRPMAAPGTCTWGGAAEPAGAIAVAVAPPPVACAAPQAIACEGGSASASDRGGCGCSHASAGDGLLALAGLLALRWRRSRAPRAVPNLRS